VPSANFDVLSFLNVFLAHNNPPLSAMTG